jgi:hypothetical protein
MWAASASGVLIAPQACKPATSIAVHYFKSTPARTSGR